MSRFDELVEKLCPRGVEYRRLGDLLDYEQPGKYLVNSTAYDDRCATPVLTAGQTFILGYTDEADGVYPASPAAPVVIFDDFTTAFKWVDFPFKAKSSAMKMLTARPTSGTSLRYLYFAMQTIAYAPQDHARQWISTYSQFRVPVPPLEVQREIVRALDLFAKLEAELEAELEARRHQYAHYRDSLLAFREAGGVRWVRMGDVVAIGTGSRNTNQAVAGGTYPFFVRSQELLAIDEAEFDETAVITAGDGVGVGKVFHFIEGAYALHQRAYRLCVSSDLILPRFLFHFIRHDFPRYLATTSVHASVTSLRKPMFEKYPIPIPPLEEQARIVAILDKFDALVNDLSVGLPAELAARRKQYEHYRDRLLTFKEAVA